MKINYVKTIADSLEDLTRYEQAYRGDRRIFPRLQMLRALKSGHVRSIRQLAPILGYNRTHMEGWWRLYCEGGLPAVVETGQWGGHRRERVSPEALAALKAKAEAGEFPTLESARRYLGQKWDVHYPHVQAISALFRRHKIKKKTGRPRHRKANAEEQEAFKEQLRERVVEEEIESTWAFDEGRFGLKVWFRRRWCPVGKRPPWVTEDRYEWTWLYAAVCPHTGESFFLLLPHVDSQCLERFLTEWDAHLGDGSPRNVGVVLDNSGAHRSKKVTWPERFEPIPLPPYSPELNPAEQLFRMLRRDLSNRVFESVEKLRDAIGVVLGQWRETPSLLVRLCGYPWWPEGRELMQVV